MQQTPAIRSHGTVDATLQRVLELHGYVPLDTPILQPADLFLTRAGDQLITRLFTFEHTGKQIALRPEFTSPAMSRYIREGHVRPVRWQFGGIVFEQEDDSTQRERHSIGAEAIGWPSGLADAEILALAVHGLHEAGVQGVRVHAGHVGLLRAMLGRHVQDSRIQRFLLNHVQMLRQPNGIDLVWAEVKRLLGSDRRDATPGNGNPSPEIVDALLQPAGSTILMGGRSREDIQRRLRYKAERAGAMGAVEQAMLQLKSLTTLEGSMTEILGALRGDGWLDATQESLLDEWEHILKVAVRLGVLESQIVLTPALSRNWDYYSGLVFELHSDGKHLGGGGRYDELARLLGADNTIPAVGFAYSMDDIGAISPINAESKRTISLQMTGDFDQPFVRQWAYALRANGVIVELQPEPGEGILMVDAEGLLHIGDSVFRLAQAAQVADRFSGDAL
jgi:histidyl-tRNA synthetase